MYPDYTQLCSMYELYNNYCIVIFMPFLGFYCCNMRTYIYNTLHPFPEPFLA